MTNALQHYPCQAPRPGSPRHRTMRMKLVFVVAIIAMAPAADVASQSDSSPSAHESYSPDLFSGLSYRMVGPSRGGRVTAVAGHRAEPSTFYMGATGGGVWKTNYVR